MQANQFPNFNSSKINCVFKTSNGKTFSILFDTGRTVEDLILTFFKRVDQVELFQKGGVSFIYNTEQIDYHLKTRVENYGDGAKLYMEVTIMYGYNVVDGLKNFKEKSKKFEEFFNGRSIEDALMEEEEKQLANIDLDKDNIPDNSVLNSYKVFENKIVDLPTNKTPIIIAGGSFNAKGRITMTNEDTMFCDSLHVNNRKQPAPGACVFP